MELSEDEIKYIFNLDKLYPGDILLINDYEERLITKAGSKYIHAAVYMGDAQIIASDGLGVGMNHIFSFGFKENDDAKAFRVKGVT